MKEVTDEQISVFEKMHGIKLLPYQKEILKIMVNQNIPVTISMVKDNGRTYYGQLINFVTNDICGGEK